MGDDFYGGKDKSLPVALFGYSAGVAVADCLGQTHESPMVVLKREAHKCAESAHCLEGLAESGRVSVKKAREYH